MSAFALDASSGVHPERRAWKPSPVRATLTPATSLGGALLDRLERAPDGVAYYVFDAAGELERLTVADLAARAGGAASAFEALGAVKGDRIGICADTGPDMLAAFFGAALLGAVPFVVEPPLTAGRLAVWRRRSEHIVRTAAPRLLAADGVARAATDELAAGIGVPLVSPPFGVAPEASATATADAEQLAFLQFTSGTTSDSKGVGISYRALRANAHALGERSPYLAGDVMVGWLPLHHDMGLVGATLTPFLHDLPAVLLPPRMFAFHPVRWLWAVHCFRGTLSPAPNFAYQRCARRFADGALAGLDLSSWRVAFNGAECVDAGTLRGWQARLGPYGFRAGSMRPAYGMAELTLCAALPHPDATPRVRCIDRALLAQTGRAVAATDEREILEVVSVGPAVPGHRIVVVDELGAAVADGVQGEILVAGPSLMSGYYRHGVAVHEQPADGWLRTGDIGFLADSELYVTGRRKDLIILAGNNYQPYPLEAAAAAVPGVYDGGVVAIGGRDPQRGTEALIVLFETRAAGDPQRSDELCASIEQAIASKTGLRPHRVVAMKPGSLPRTSSGKLQRRRIGELVAARDLAAVAEV